MSPFATAGAGFLLAVLWFDLMFDVQALRRPPGRLPEPLLASIAAYYARVTTAARPMNRLVAAAMLGTIAALVVELAESRQPAWVAGASLVLTLSAVLLAAARTVPSAVRLGARRDPPDEQSRLARTVLRQHLLCFGAIAAALVLQLAAS